MTLDNQMTTKALLRERISSHTIRIKDFWTIYKGSRTGMIGLSLILTFIIIAFIAPWLAPYHPRALVGTPFLPPTEKHLLGTDQVGRDIYSGLIWGNQNFPHGGATG